MYAIYVIYDIARKLYVLSLFDNLIAFGPVSIRRNCFPGLSWFDIYASDKL